MKIERRVTPPETTTPVRWYIFQNRDILCSSQVYLAGKAAAAPVEILPYTAEYLGLAAGAHCFCAEAEPHSDLPEDVRRENFRALYRHLSYGQYRLAGYAFQVKEWARNHQYCGRCGRKTDRIDGERARTCRACDLRFYPRISPAIIVAVTRKDSLLLAHNARFRPNLYSLIAGFVEPGEEPEEAVAREIAEEVGISVTNIRYVCSQSHPFPDSLMLGFTAEYAAGELRPDQDEITRAGWFSSEDLKDIELPPKAAVARTLIDRAFSRKG
ncbi:MAG: NAD(+) diphosphatase [Fibrobacterota bacterium]